jgi:hypothetical protein
VTDHRDVQVVADIGRHHRLEQPVRPVRGGLGRQPPQPRGDPVDMGVHRERGPAQGEGKHTRGRLRAHAGQRLQVGPGCRVVEIMEEAEINAALAFADGGQDLLDAARLLVGDAATADRVGDLPRGRGRHLLPAGEPVLELRERPLRIDVRGVLRQDGGHHLVDDRQHRLGGERALFGAQAALHVPDSDLAGRRHSWMVSVAEREAGSV